MKRIRLPRTNIISLGGSLSPRCGPSLMTPVTRPIVRFMSLSTSSRMPFSSWSFFNSIVTDRPMNALRTTELRVRLSRRTRPFSSIVALKQIEYHVPDGSSSERDKRVSVCQCRVCTLGISREVPPHEGELILLYPHKLSPHQPSRK